MKRAPDREDPEKTPFLPILIYVFGFLLALALLAFTAAWLLRHL